MKKILTCICSFIFCIICSNTNAQTNTFPSTGSAGIGTTTPDASALLEMKSTTKGLLIPRMTKSKRDAIVSPANGLMIYQTNNSPGFYYFNGSSWLFLGTGAGANKSLSNLTATSINQSLLPSTGKTFNLGDSTKVWKNIYTSGELYHFKKRVFSVKGTDNLFVGSLAGSNNTTGGGNVFMGNNAGYMNVTGGHNVFMGNNAGYHNVDQVDLVIIGDSAGYNINTDGGTILNGNDAVFIGSHAGFSNTRGFSNTAVGSYSFTSNIDGDNNTVLGFGSLYSSQHSISNVALGSYTLNNYNPGGYSSGYNVAIGDHCMQNLDSGSFNIGIGYGSLSSDFSIQGKGSNNISIGGNSLRYNTTGSNNTVVGNGALHLNSIGSGNTALGDSAGINNTSGNNNLFLGAFADALIGNLVNATAIGYNAKVKASNSIVLGDSVANTNVAIGTRDPGNYKLKVVEQNYGFNLEDKSGHNWEQYVNSSLGNLELYYNSSNILLGSFDHTSGAYSALSDERMKKNIQPMTSMLDKINKLKPVSYTFKTDNNNRLHLGFIAQDVQKIFPSFVTHTTVSSRKLDEYLMDYSGFGVIAIKGIQELEQQVQQKDDKIADLQSQINELKNMVMAMQQCLPCNGNVQSGSASSAIGNNNASLKQNVPNPFTHSTIISYYIPQKFSSAHIVITDKNGRTIKSINVPGNGNGSINVDASTLSSGAYQYSLIIDGKQINTKQMLITK